jgi:hypothetical protein
MDYILVRHHLCPYAQRAAAVLAENPRDAPLRARRRAWMEFGSSVLASFYWRFVRASSVNTTQGERT